MVRNADVHPESIAQRKARERKSGRRLWRPKSGGSSENAGVPLVTDVPFAAGIGGDISGFGQTTGDIYGSPNGSLNSTIVGGQPNSMARAPSYYQQPILPTANIATQYATPQNYPTINFSEYNRSLVPTTPAYNPTSFDDIRAEIDASVAFTDYSGGSSGFTNSTKATNLAHNQTLNTNATGAIPRVTPIQTSRSRLDALYDQYGISKEPNTNVGATTGTGDIYGGGGIGGGNTLGAEGQNGTGADNAKPAGGANAIYGDYYTRSASRFLYGSYYSEGQAAKHDTEINLRNNPMQQPPSTVGEYASYPVTTQGAPQLTPNQTGKFANGDRLDDLYEKYYSDQPRGFFEQFRK
jgi:hypothetical protein